ncbi:MAG: hypothetical protein IJ122_06140 [Methanobrevibacter sp.]|nr:hypothetical protein [Methanobrevibacter sp.]
MAHTNQTANYNLPEFVATDKPAWLVDFNDAMDAIDSAIPNIALTTTDPGEGVNLAPNHFIAVYEA